MEGFTEIRVQRREKYFGHKTHKHLSKLTAFNFKERRDNYFLIDMLGGSSTMIEEEELANLLDKLVQEKLQDKTIDWDAIDKYYHERLEYIETHPHADNDLQTRRLDDVLEVLVVLATYRDEITANTKNDTFCLY